MKKAKIGEVVKQCRLSNGFTQEELCSGICSISTLSRIENGQQYPSRSVFTLLFEKMGEEEILYDDYMGDYDYEIYNLSYKVTTCLKRCDYPKAENYLNKLRFIIGDTSDVEEKGRYIYKFIELLFASYEWTSSERKKDKIEISQYGYYLYEEIRKMFEKCMDLDYNRGNANLDKMEIRMLNFMGYAKFLQEDYKSAIDIWVRLLNGYRDKDDDGVGFVEERASLYCNISAALSALGLYDEAKAFSDKGIRLCFDGGSLRLVNRLLHNRMYCLKLKGDNNKAYIDLALSKAICNCLKKDILKEERLKKLPSTPYLIQIF
ncbi:MAG: helix-turn-helix domain-containing protein [Lachnospiraceae bacterium]|nr:helix-turn-helix domain-containing protein [Lachnospiraceae bacterium]